MKRMKEMNHTRELLQSENWLAFQASVGREIIRFSSDDFLANGIIHRLPLVGTYLYIPRGPITGNSQQSTGNKQQLRGNIQKLIEEAKEKNVKWIRIEPQNEEVLQGIKEAFDGGVLRAPHNMQPKEIFVMDITKDEEMLLAQMKSKTRYNIRLAEKRGVKVFETREEKYIAAFLDLITATSGRKGITSHSREYYKKFFTTLPGEMCQLFVAEYEGRIIAANIVIFYGDTVTYLHGGTADEHRDVMAPYLLQWEQIRVAKARGHYFYDFGGVKTASNQHKAMSKNQESKNKNDWNGITRFKVGFSPQTQSTMYPGAYDIVLDARAYFFYNFLRHPKNIIHSLFR